MTLFRQFIVRALLRDRPRTVVTVVGLTLGVAVVVAIRLANASSIRGFETALDVVAGKTSLEIVGAGVGVPETQLRDLGWLRDYGRVSPVIDRIARVRAPDGTEYPVRVLGVDVLRDRPFREYRLLRFARDGRDPRPQELLALLLDPTSVVLTQRFAGRHAIELDTPVQLIIGDRVHGAVVRGLLLDEGPARVVDGQLALMDIATAQLLFDRLGWLDRVEIQLFDAETIDDAEGAIATRLPDGLRVQRPAQRGRQVERMLAAFHFNLTALSYIALVVGLFLVYNTVAVSVITRRREIGTLRALGATRRLVRRLFLGEAALLAMVGAGLGLPAGWLLAQAAVRLTSTTVNVLYITSAATVPALSAGDLLLACAVAIPLALAGAAIPSAEAAGVTPIAAVRDVDRFVRDRGVPRRSAALAMLLFGAGWWLSTREAVGGLPVFGLGRPWPSCSVRRRWCRPCSICCGGCGCHGVGSGWKACWRTPTCPPRSHGWRCRWRRWWSVLRCWRPWPSWSAAFATRLATGSDRRCRATSSWRRRTGRPSAPRSRSRQPPSDDSRPIPPSPRSIGLATSICRMDRTVI